MIRVDSQVDDKDLRKKSNYIRKYTTQEFGIEPYYTLLTTEPDTYAVEVDKPFSKLSTGKPYELSQIVEDPWAEGRQSNYDVAH